MILSARVSFPSKIYITLGINSLEKLINFLINFLVVNSVKNDNFFRSVNIFVMCASLVKAKILQKHQF